jgi:hypothetical protein
LPSCNVPRIFGFCREHSDGQRQQAASEQKPECEMVKLWLHAYEITLDGFVSLQTLPAIVHRLCVIYLRIAS